MPKQPTRDFSAAQIEHVAAAIRAAIKPGTMAFTTSRTIARRALWMAREEHDKANKRRKTRADNRASLMELVTNELDKAEPPPAIDRIDVRLEGRALATHLLGPGTKLDVLGEISHSPKSFANHQKRPQDYPIRVTKAGYLFAIRGYAHGKLVFEHYMSDRPLRLDFGRAVTAGIIVR